MLGHFKFILNSVAYGLAAALVIVILTPQLRSNLDIASFTDNVISPNAMSFAYAVKQAAPAVVNIYSVSIERNNLSQQQVINDLGSGVIMSRNGHILTNYHVVDDAELIRVDLQDGRSLNAEVLGLDRVTDLALLKIDAENLPVVPQDPELEAQVGDIVLAIGNPFNLGQTITQGIISATGKRGRDQRTSHSELIQMDAAINVGNSGGALVNSQGKLVGINAGVQRGTQGIYYAIPYKLTKSIMEKLLADGEVKRGYLGLNGTPINHMGVPVRSSVDSIAGIKLTNVDPLGPAWNAGLQTGDVLLSFDGKQLISYEYLLALVESIEPGEVIEIQLSRNSKLLTKLVNVGRLETSN